MLSVCDVCVTCCLCDCDVLCVCVTLCVTRCVTCGWSREHPWGLGWRWRLSGGWGPGLSWERRSLGRSFLPGGHAARGRQHRCSGPSLSLRCPTVDAAGSAALARPHLLPRTSSLEVPDGPSSGMLEGGPDEGQWHSCLDITVGSRVPHDAVCCHLVINSDLPSLRCWQARAGALWPPEWPPVQRLPLEAPFPGPRNPSPFRVALCPTGPPGCAVGAGCRAPREEGTGSRDSRAGATLR